LGSSAYIALLNISRSLPFLLLIRIQTLLKYITIIFYTLKDLQKIIFDGGRHLGRMISDLIRDLFSNNYCFYCIHKIKAANETVNNKIMFVTSFVLPDSENNIITNIQNSKP
jgi:hypothetical protein